jgi:phosphoglycolate phosphatase-like HAD superfamily hydrolase
MRSCFFLDFDGVICDSIPECFLSSYTAYRELLLGETVKAVPLRDKALFYAYRPFIRSGEDYLLIHDIIRRGVVVGSQDAFDREIARAGKQRMAEYGRLFYRARENILAADRQFWLDLNPLFPGMRELLLSAAENRDFYILSTKKPPFIREILLRRGIAWNTRRILFPGKETKKDVIESIMLSGGGGGAVFVDDQLDHLLVAAENKNIAGYLAAWGYVKQPWLAQTGVPVIHFEDLRKLIMNFGTSR